MRRASIISGSRTSSSSKRASRPIPSNLLKSMGYDVNQSAERVARARRGDRHRRRMAAGRIRRPRQWARPRDISQRDHSNAPRAFYAPLREASTDDGVARSDLGRRNSTGRDFLRAPASGLSRSGADRRTGPLVSRFSAKAAFAAFADVFGRCLGPHRPGRRDQSH